MSWFYNLLILWIFIGLSTFIFLIFSNTVAPYGRHSSSKWGLMIDNRWGWFWMELPALLIMPVIILTSPVEKNNTIFVKNLILTNNNKINEIEKIQVDYIDKENLENKIKLMKINDNYLINGNSFNINKIISVLLEADNSKNKNVTKNFLSINHSS